MPTLYQSPLFSLYEPEFQLRPPAIHGQMKVGWPSRGDFRSISSPLRGSMVLTKFHVWIIGHTFWILPVARSYTNTNPLLFWCTASLLPCASTRIVSPSVAS